MLALYDYDAQQEGNPSFREDDRIELIERTSDTNDWWTGELNGRQDIFSGKREKLTMKDDSLLYFSS